MEYVKDFCASDAHPEMIDAGFWGRFVFRELIRLCGQFDLRGQVPRKYALPAYLARRCGLTETGVGVPDPDARMADGLASACSAGLLVPHADHFEIPGWQKHYESDSTPRVRAYRIRKAAEAKAALSTEDEARNVTSVTERYVTPRQDKTRRDETKTKEEAAAVAAPPLLSLSEAPKPKTKKPRKAAKPGDPRFRPLRDALVDAFKLVRGAGYVFDQEADPGAIKALIARADDAEILRRWRAALENPRYPRVDTIAQLASARVWNNGTGAPPLKASGMAPVGQDWDAKF